MAPVVHRLERDYAGKIGFVYLDTDDPAVTPLKKQLHYRSMPQLILLDAGGNPVRQWLGPTSAESLSSTFDAVLAGETVP